MVRYCKNDCSFRKNAFSATPVTAFFSLGLKLLRFSMEVFRICLPYVKRYFQSHQWKLFFFRSQTTQILLFLGMSVWERSKITVYLSKNIFCYGGFRCVSTLRKNVFSAKLVDFLYFRAQITQILLFWGMPVWERSNVTV